MQVDVPQQPLAGHDNADYGVNTCGVLAPLYFRRFLLGVELYARDDDHVTGVNSNKPIRYEEWLVPHMVRPLNCFVMEAARASAMRYMLEAVLRFGKGWTLTDVDNELKTSFDSMYALCHLHLHDALHRRGIPILCMNAACPIMLGVATSLICEQSRHVSYHVQASQQKHHQSRRNRMERALAWQTRARIPRR